MLAMPLFPNLHTRSRSLSRPPVLSSHRNVFVASTVSPDLHGRHVVIGEIPQRAGVIRHVELLVERRRGELLQVWRDRREVGFGLRQRVDHLVDGVVLGLDAGEQHVVEGVGLHRPRHPDEQRDRQDLREVAVGKQLAARRQVLG
jgi:hypothetical protein